MNNNSTDSTRSGGSNLKIQSFLEALRNSQNRSSGQDGSETKSHNPFTEFQAKKEIEKRRAEQFHQARQQEWNKVFSATEKQTERKIEEIRDQLRQLAKQLKRLDVNLIKVIEAPVVGGGEYHESYFTHIKRMLHLFSLKVNSTNSWLEMYQSRATKKGVYWGMAKSKGSSYTQNNERSVATSVG
jgi:hypothetical protein